MSKSASRQDNSKGTILVALILLVVLGYVSYQLFLKNTRLKQLEQNEVSSSAPTLPENAVKVSGCVPFMGEHWVEPDKIPFGPYYIAHNNKVIGIEYMFTPEEVPGEFVAKASPEAAGKYMQENNLSFADLVKTEFTFPLNSLKFKYAAIEWSAPHAGYISPHYDVHFYLVDEAEVESICPEATIKDAQSPEIERELQKRAIPYNPLPEGVR